MRGRVAPGLLLFTLALQAEPPRLLAVLEIHSKLKGKEAEQIDAGYLTDVIRAVALKAPGVSVMTRENMLVLLGGSKSLAECEGECEVETGRRLGADLVVSGEVLRYGSSFKLSLKMHETRDGRLLSAVQASGADADALEKSLRGAVTELMANAGPPAAAALTRCEIALPAEGCVRHREHRPRLRVVRLVRRRARSDRAFLSRRPGDRVQDHHGTLRDRAPR